MLHLHSEAEQICQPEQVLVDEKQREQKGQYMANFYFGKKDSQTSSQSMRCA